MAHPPTVSHTYIAAIIVQIAAISLLAAGVSSCGGDDPEPGSSSMSNAIKVAPTSPAPASGGTIAVHVNEAGDIVCTKSDGGPWTSAYGGHVEFFLRDAAGTWHYAGYKDYPPQPDTEPLYELSLDNEALGLPVGADYGAKCVAMPYIDVSADPLSGFCDNTETGESDQPCYESGIYAFSVIPGVPVDPTPVFTNCGQGAGEAHGYNICVPMHLRDAGTYDYQFQCVLGHHYDVKLTTAAHGQTTLTVLDAEGGIYDMSASNTADDDIPFTSVSNSDTCVARVEAVVPSKFKLNVRERTTAPKNGAVLLRQHRWTTIVDAGHGKPNDSAHNIYEREFNVAIANAIRAEVGTPNVHYEAIGYDETILPWAAVHLKTSREELRAREEMEGTFGEDGYRGYLSRLWATENGRDPYHVVLVQIHNDNWTCKLGLCEDVGSEAFFAARTLSPGLWPDPEQWLDALIEGMDSVGEPWLGELDTANDRAAFVRGATGYTVGCGGLKPEHDCEATMQRSDEYGPPLWAAAILEVAHNEENVLHYASTHETNEDFVAAVGKGVGEHIREYLATQSGR